MLIVTLINLYVSSAIGWTWAIEFVSFSGSGNGSINERLNRELIRNYYAMCLCFYRWKIKGLYKMSLSFKDIVDLNNGYIYSSSKALNIV